jgi:transposase-like protein
MIRTNVQKTVGKYLSKLMDVGVELTEFSGRGRDERFGGGPDHSSGSHPRNSTLKGVGEVGVKVLQTRNGRFKINVFPRRKHGEDALRQNINVMFLACLLGTLG